jgi:thioredoxin reductase
MACEQACLGRLYRGLHISCVSNPVTGREMDWATWEPADERRKVVVVGGGPAGMEAAIVAGRRGHDVVLYERQRQLGGQIVVASKASTRQEWGDLIGHKIGQLEKAGVRVSTGVEATARTVLDENPDAVVLATGSLPSRPDIPGVDAPHVVTAADVLGGTAEVGESVLVVDHVNRHNGPTTACQLAELGKRVEIVTQGPFIGHKLEIQNFTFQHQRLFGLGVVLTPHASVTAIEPGRVTLRNEFTGAERIIEGIETVVLATPGRADNRLLPDLRDKVKVLHVVGDCHSPRDAEAAILEGHRAGHEV